MLFKFLQHNGHPLTEDGCFIAYRSVKENFKDHHTGSIDNSPGKFVEMDRSTVDDNPDNTCSSGLHVASYDYASGFGYDNKKLVEVKVNPKDVVAVPRDYDGTKMRVCRFQVIRECDGIKEAPHYEEEERYLVREKGIFKLKWNEVLAADFELAAIQYRDMLESERDEDFVGTILVRKGSNTYKTFEFGKDLDVGQKT